MAGRVRAALRRAGRRTNVALLVVLVGAFLSGWAAFAAGTEVPSRLTTVGHGLLGLGVVVLTPWKTMVARRAPALRVASLALAAVIVVCLVAGFVEVFAGYGLAAGLSPIQVHVGAAFVAVPLLVWHLVRHRRGQVLRRTDLDRRQLLRTAGFVAGSGWRTRRWRESAGLRPALGAADRQRLAPARARRRPGYHLAAGPGAVAAGRPPRAGGRRGDPGRRPGRAGRAGAGPPGLHQRLVRRRRVVGRALSSLLSAARLAEASSIVVTSVTGYRRRFPVGDADALWLATGFEGGPLTRGTGAPVRLVAPGRRGFWWVKWVASVELSDTPGVRAVTLPAAVAPLIPAARVLRPVLAFAPAICGARTRKGANSAQALTTSCSRWCCRSPRRRSSCRSAASSSRRSGRAGRRRWSR